MKLSRIIPVCGCGVPACVLSSLLCLQSCDHKDVYLGGVTSGNTDVEAEYELDWEQPYDGRTDWETDWPAEFGISYESLRPLPPEGLRVVAYNEDGSVNQTNIPAGGGEINLRSGYNSLLFYNNDTEYIVFSGLDRYATATATTRTRVRSTYMGNPFAPSVTEENTVNPPDMLYGHYIDSYYAVRSADNTKLPVTMHPLVFTYLVRYEFKSGLEHVVLARGALSGMAASVSLCNGHTSAETATVLYDCSVQPSYGVEARVHSFGVPDFPNDSYTRGGDKYGLNLEVRLTNGNILSFDFDVTDQVEAQPHGGVIVVKDIEIPDDAASGGSAFDVDVTGWGEYHDIEIQF